MNRKNMLILGGNSNKNISWIEEMYKEYNTNYNVDIIKYDNWFNDTIINIEHEINKISDILKTKKIDIVVAKSIGILLTINAINMGILKSEIIVFMGYPLKFFVEEKIDILQDLFEISSQCKMLFIQQDKDPLCHANELKEIVSDKISIVNIKGNDHAYNNIKIIKTQIDNFIES